MLASQFLLQLQNLSKEDLLAIKGIGEVLAQNYLDFVRSPRYQQLVQEFTKIEQTTPDRSLRIIKSSPARDTKNSPLAGEVICITGTFEQPRAKIKAKLEQLGAKVTNSITSHTTRLLVGSQPGSKLAKAQTLGIPITSNLADLGVTADLD